MSSLDDWQNDAEESVFKLETSVKALVDEHDKKAKNQCLKDANLNLSEANDNIDTFGIQIRKTQGSDMLKYQDKKNELADRVKAAKAEIKKQTQIVERSALMEGNTIEGEQGGDMLLQHALKIQDKTRDAINQTLLTLNETKQVASNTTTALNQQTEQIDHMNVNVKSIDQELNRSDRLIKDFAVRMMTDKLIMVFITIIVIGIIAAIILYLVFKQDETPTAAPAPPTAYFRQVFDSVKQLSSQ
ncbi:hypothetical protein WA158_005097 [Blastocystis sp. Blastoise]